LLTKKPNWAGVVILDSSECIDHIIFDVPEEIQLDYKITNPRTPVRRAMEYVPRFFNTGVVELKQKKNQRRMLYLELKRD